MFLTGIVILIVIFGSVLWLNLPEPSDRPTFTNRIAYVVSFIGLTGGLYLFFGNPDYLKPRLVDSENSVARSIQPSGIKPAETYGALVASNATDKDKWLDVAAALQAVQRPVEAADALSRAAELSQSTTEKANLYGAAGEVLVRANNGGVSPDAAAAFEAAHSLDETSLGALYYLGLNARSEKNPALARTYWSQFLAFAPENHPLINEVRGAVTLLQDPSIESEPIAPLLTPEMMGRFADLSEEERRSQIVQMLQRAEDRFANSVNGASVGQWRELARAYTRMNDIDRAITAYDRAIRLDPENSALALERSQLPR